MLPEEIQAQQQAEQQQQQIQQPQIVGAVALKLPSFWENKANSWFRHVEAQFHIKNITSDTTKFHYVIAALAPEVVDTVDEEIDNAEPGTKYTLLKQALLDRYTAPPVQRLLEFFEMPSITPDQTPAQLADIIRPFSKFSDKQVQIARFIWKMPAHIQPLLIREADQFASLKEAAKAAEALMTRTKAATQFVSAVSRRPHNHKIQPKSRGGLCHFHHKFGAKARKCEQPCSWNGKIAAIDFEEESAGNATLFH